MNPIFPNIDNAPDEVQALLRWISEQGPGPGPLAQPAAREMSVETLCNIFGYWLRDNQTLWNIRERGSVPLWVEDTMFEPTWYQNTRFYYDNRMPLNDTDRELLHNIGRRPGANIVKTVFIIPWNRTRAPDRPIMRRRALRNMLEAYWALECRPGSLEVKVILYANGWADITRNRPLQESAHPDENLQGIIIDLFSHCQILLERLRRQEITLVELVTQLEDPSPRETIRNVQRYGIVGDHHVACQIMSIWITQTAIPNQIQGPTDPYLRNIFKTTFPNIWWP